MPRFVCEKPYDARRHVKSHKSQGQKATSKLVALWNFLLDKSKTLNRTINQKHLTSFRKALNELEDAEPTQSSSVSWDTRLHVGKTGTTARMLINCIDLFGTNWGPNKLPLQNEYKQLDDETDTPLPGHTIKFNVRDGDTLPWFGLCCGKFEEVDVFGDLGQGCKVRWFNESHRTEHNGSMITFYELLEDEQVQLLETMHDWGNLLVYHREEQLFVLPDERGGLVETPVIDPTNVGISDLRAKHTSGTAPEKEDLVLLRALVSTHALHFVDEKGLPTKPIRCQNGVHNCAWQPPYERETFNRIPVLTSNGPVFTTGTRYRCTTHDKTIEAGSDDLEEDQRLSIHYHRIGDMRYEPTLLAEVQTMYVDTLTTASVRRRILSTWFSHALKIVEAVKIAQAAQMLRTKKLQRAASLLIRVLVDFVPSEQSLKKVLLAMYQQLVLPNMKAYNEAVCAFDGQIVRLDGTFKSATVVRLRDLTTRHGKKKCVLRRVAGAVLVAIGLEGLCLLEPRLVPWESGHSMYGLVNTICVFRRAALGSLSAPAAFTTDNIRQHQSALLRGLWNVYPELAIAAQHAEVGDKPSVLLLQDIAHREWQFTKKVAGPRSKQHADYSDYIRCMKDVFHQLRLPHKIDEDLKSYTEHNARWRLTQTTRKIIPTVFLKHLLAGLLHSDKSTTTDDELTVETLLELGNAAIIALDPTVAYIPRSFLMRAARRLGIDHENVRSIFPDHGYSDGETFLFHLRGANDFFKTTRSQARGYTIQAVVGSLGEPQGGWSQWNKRTGKSKSIRRQPKKK
jgi:hypothetical protein